eukprot:gene16382-biopygen740
MLRAGSREQGAGTGEPEERGAGGPTGTNIHRNSEFRLSGGATRVPYPCVPPMGPFGIERGHTRRCGVYLKPFLAALNPKNILKSVKNSTPGWASQWTARGLESTK